MSFGNYASLLLFAFCTPLLAQDPATSPENPWNLRHRVEIRVNYRDSEAERFQLRFPFPPSFLPPGQRFGFLETPDPGSRAELSVVNLQLDADYGKWFGARARFHLVDKHRYNPTSSDRRVDFDELFIRVGQKPEMFDRPDGTSFFAQIGKAPKMERQPLRLLESYGLASNAFNRFEDTQLLVGGTAGRSFYWRLQVANGNPLFFRDPNALAGDNGTPRFRQPDNPNPVPELGSGFPILYNAETESLAFEAEHLQFGQALGFRWQSADASRGFDAIVFHYKRELADAVDLTGTFYRGDLKLLNGPFNLGGLPISGRNKEESGARIFAEWSGLTAIAQVTLQDIADLGRIGIELEAGYRFAWKLGPLVSIQPALRYSQLENDFVGNAAIYPAPSVWWDWQKIDAGIRIGFERNIDLTIERAMHDVEAPRELNIDETLVTFRWRI